MCFMKQFWLQVTTHKNSFLGEEGGRGRQGVLSPNCSINFARVYVIVHSSSWQKVKTEMKIRGIVSTLSSYESLRINYS